MTPGWISHIGILSLWTRAGLDLDSLEITIVPTSTRRHSPQHPPEDQPVDRVEPGPVEEPSQPQRIEDGRLGDPTAALRRLDLELEPGPAGHFHLRGEPQEAILLPRLQPSEVERVPCPQLHRVPSPPPHPYPAHEEIKETPQVPEPGGEIPTLPSPDPLADRPRPQQLQTGEMTSRKMDEQFVSVS